MSQQTLFDEKRAGDAGNGSSRARLLRQLRHLADEVLPARARRSRNGRHGPAGRGYPVTEDHCFRRIAYDAALGCRWDDAVPRPFEVHAGLRQLRRALKALKTMVDDPGRARALNRKSLRHRTRSWAGRTTAAERRVCNNGLVNGSKP